jgi:hypothetical protein
MQVTDITQLLLTSQPGWERIASAKPSPPSPPSPPSHSSLACPASSLGDAPNRPTSPPDSPLSESSCTRQRAVDPPMECPTRCTGCCESQAG